MARIVSKKKRTSEEEKEKRKEGRDNKNKSRGVTGFEVVTRPVNLWQPTSDQCRLFLEGEGGLSLLPRGGEKGRRWKRKNRSRSGTRSSWIILGIYSSTTFSLSHPAQDRWIALKGERKREGELAVDSRESHFCHFSRTATSCKRIVFTRWKSVSRFARARPYFTRR